MGSVSRACRSWLSAPSLSPCKGEACSDVATLAQVFGLGLEIKSVQLSFQFLALTPASELPLGTASGIVGSSKVVDAPVSCVRSSENGLDLGSMTLAFNILGAHESELACCPTRARPPEALD